MMILVDVFITYNLIFLHKFLFCIHFCLGNDLYLPMVINTWGFKQANEVAFMKLLHGGTAIDAVEVGCGFCEAMQCDGTVGYGGSPDENGETTLDAMIMDGKTMNVGAVGALRNVKNAVAVAKYVLKYTTHSFLVGSQATKFAIQMGFREESLSTKDSKNIWKNWQKDNCQPNFWINVVPNPRQSCGPYKPNYINNFNSIVNKFDSKNHDTIGMIAIDKDGNIAVATSTNGARHKIPGRVGDSPIIGAGGYAENGVGGAAATGDGDIIMRFLPSFKAVESLKAGLSPQESAEIAIKTIIKYYTEFVGGIVVVSANGIFGAACHGISKFPFSITRNDFPNTQVQEVNCLNSFGT